MAVRVTSTEVKAIMLGMTAILEGKDIDAFITAANIIVTDRLSSSGLSVATLKEIERWVAAHAICLDSNKPNQRSTGSSNESYGLPLGKQLEMTSYGQMALQLDTSGVLGGDSGFVFETLWDTDNG